MLSRAVAKSGRKTRIGIFGGSFDPIHNGHVQIVKDAHDQLGLDRVFLVPSYRNPLKPEMTTSPKHRVAMMRLALQGLTFTRISRFELTRRGKSFTIRTIRHFRKRFGNKAELYFIMGNDLLPQLRRWKQIHELFKLCFFAVAHRSGEPAHVPARMPQGSSGRIVSFRMKQIRVSSSDVQTSMRRHWPKVKNIAPSVSRYILKHQLYGLK
jgi:nicotinate-nucleotide adenylyltransferase